MKSKIKRRIIALMLCLSMILNGSVSVLADDNTLTDEQQVVIEEQVEGEAIEEVVEDVVEEEAIEEIVEQTEVIEEVVETTVEEKETALIWSEDGVTVTVSEKVAGAIPEGATLSVTPIIEGDEYTDVEKQLQEKAADEEYEIAGFLAYDICLVDAAGNEIEPNDDVNVSIEYDEAVIPEMEVAEDAALDVTVMHFEEDENGEVAQIVDMIADENEEATVTTTEATEVEKTKFVTDSFSTFTITWTYSYDSTEYSANITVHYVDQDGDEIQGGQTETVILSTKEPEISLSTYQSSISGYTYKDTVINSHTSGISVTDIRIVSNDYYYTLQYKSGNSWSDWSIISYRNDSFAGDIYIVYEAPKTSVEAKIVDTNGNSISGYTKTTIDVRSGKEVILKDIASDVVGYGYEKAVLTTDVTAVASGLAIKSLTYDGAVVTYKTSSGLTGTVSSDQNIYLIYYEISSEITISNLIASADNSGCLVPVLSGDLATATEADGAVVTYKWYKSTGGDYTESVRTRYGDNVYSIAADGSWINVVLDNGSKSTTQPDVTYIVKVYINGELAGTSDEFEIPYWDELQNGSFETPNLTDASNQFANDEYDDFIWKTTGLGTGDRVGDDIEVLDVSTETNRNNVADWYEWKTNQTPAAADGTQFAELNCEASGSLYQDVLTVAGKELNYWFSHRARGTDPNTTEEDTMYVVIVPSHIALNGLNGVTNNIEGNTNANLSGAIDHQEEVNALINYINSNASEAAQLGLKVETKKSDDQSWHAYQGTYTATSYLTRFFFVAGETASGNNTVGNFLDYVGFSQDLPPASPGTFEIRIEKTISGLSATEFATLKNQLKFVVNTEKRDSTTNDSPHADGTEIAANDEKFEWVDNQDGTYTGTYSLVGNLTSLSDKYTYTITETNTSINGYKLVPTIKIDSTEVDEASADVQERTSVKMTFTNTYEYNKVKNIKFEKLWNDYNNAYNTRPDSIQVTLVGKDVDGNTVYTNTATVTKDADWTYTWTGVPIYDQNGKKIIWSVTEEAISGYKIEENSPYTDKDAALNTIDKVSMPAGTVDYSVGDIPARPQQALMMAFALRSVSEDTEEATEEVSTYATTSSTYASSSSTYAGRPGSTSSSTFNHIDIQAEGSYEFVFDGETYTVTFDFQDGTWTCTNASGGVESSGTLSVADMVITQKDTDNDDSTFDEKNITSEGSWQSSNISGQSSEYRISGTFDRDDTFEFYFEIPVKITDTDENGNTYTVAEITLVSNFETSYSDTEYNICPTGNSRGIDIELDTAIDKAIEYNVLSLSKTFNGLNDAAVPENTTFTITRIDEDSEDFEEYEVTLNYSDFANGYSGSTSVSSVPAGVYRVVENVGTAPEGYTATTSTVTVIGEVEDTEVAASDGKSVEFKVEQGTLVSIAFVNNYTNAPQEHVLTMEKIWVDSETTHPDVTLTATLSDGSTWVETLTDSKLTASKTVDSDITIKSITETSVDGYKTTYNISSTGTSATVINTASSSTTTVATIDKVWSDEYNRYGKRPSSIEVVLYQQVGDDADTKVVYATATLTEAGNWTYTFTGLPSTITEGTSSTTYKYIVEEINVPSGYTSSAATTVTDGKATITNTLNTDELDEELYIVNTLSTKEVTLNKYWDDDNNKYNGRPDSLTLNLLKNDEVIRSTTLATSHGNYNKWLVTYVIPTTWDYDDLYISETFPQVVIGTTTDADNNTINTYLDYESYYDTYEVVEEQTDSSLVLGIVNKPAITSVTVTKYWYDLSNKYNLRPTTISFVLLRKLATEDDTAWTKYKDESDTTDASYTTYVMDSNSYDPDVNYIWRYTIDNLPLYDENGAEYEYKVQEIDVNKNYTPSYSDEFTTDIYNTLNSKIVKVSVNEDDLKLGGAVFKLVNNNDKNIVYYGYSSNDTATKGIVTWYDSYSDGVLGNVVDVKSIPNGTYTLSEIVAPEGYALSTETWQVVFENGAMELEDATKFVYNSAGCIEFEYANTPLYELPSSGSHGIYWYMIGGVMLMAFAAFVLYKNRRKEVLVR